MLNDITIRDLQKEDVATLAEFYEEGIPHAIFCALGRKFIIRFFGWLVQREEICSFAGLDKDGHLQGVIVGTLRRSESYHSTLKEHLWPLLAAAGWRLFSPRTLHWILRGVMARLKSKNHQENPGLPDAELLLIAVSPKTRGTGMAHQLVMSMESRFRHMGFIGEYMICTEASNIRANRFYQHIGATLVASKQYRGNLINSYCKAIGTFVSKEKES